MLCAISGESPQAPVVSRKSGNVYEKRLIESYITENGTEPTTGESLTLEDLLDIQTSQTVRPRPPTLTSIPALLSVFQEEWDALALETYTLQQNLAQARQELSTVLYQNDAAIRMIGRLTRERDEAREALAKINVGRSSNTNGDSMQVDNAPLPDTICAKVDSTQESLSKTRRKRPVPDGWAASADVASYTVSSTSEPLSPGLRFLATNSANDMVLVGGSGTSAGIYSVSQSRMVQTLEISNGNVIDGLWAGNRAVVSTSTGAVKVFEGQDEVASFDVHSASATSLSLHPSGDILASASNDKSYVLYDLESLRVLTQVYSDSDITCVQFHPDGHLITTGGADGQIRFHDVKTGSVLGTFDTGSALQSLYYSENGTWVAAANRGSSVVTVWDLRKVGQSTEPVKTIQTGGPVESLHWDYTAQFLLVGGPDSISVEQYSKSSKQWSEPLKLDVSASAVAWGPSARSILAVNDQGSMLVIS